MERKSGGQPLINIEVDASKTTQALDEFSHAFDKRIASALERTYAQAVHYGLRLSQR
jgi:hypothetical protein